MGRPKFRDKPVKEETFKPFPTDLNHQCISTPPCGGSCILDGRHRHQFHTCGNRQCTACHNTARFPARRRLAVFA